MSRQDEILTPSIRIDRRLPENIADSDLDDYDFALAYKTFDCRLRSIGRSNVSPNSVIFANGRVDAESLYSNDSRWYYQTRHLAKKFISGRRVALNDSRCYLLATDQESTGHFHWFTEVLPRLWQMRDRAHDFVLLLPDRPYIRTIGAESLNTLGFDFEDVMWMRDEDFLKVKNLFHISKLTRSGQMHDPVMNELRAAFELTKTHGTRKIYISRQNADRRKILNEQDVISLVGGYGFEVFDGEGLGLREQIELFSETSIVVSIHGAGLTNCLFMNAGKVVELKRAEPNHGYWHLASCLGHKYFYMNAIPDSDLSLIGTGCNLTVDLGAFESEILKGICS